MWKAPNRPANQITQSFNDGIVTVYAVEDTAKPGFRPAEGLQKKVALRYDEQRLGLNRLYLSRQNQVEIEKVLRVPRCDKISTQDVAITQNGKQYRIDSIQSADGVYPPSVDVSLTRVEQEFEVPA